MFASVSWWFDICMPPLPLHSHRLFLLPIYNPLFSNMMFSLTASSVLNVFVSDVRKRNAAPFNTVALFDIATRILLALQHMHDAGYLHLDQKPVQSEYCMSVGPRV